MNAICGTTQVNLLIFYRQGGGTGAIQPHINIENAEAKRLFKNLLDVLGVTDQLTKIKSRKATEAELSRVHLKETLNKCRL